MKFQFSADRYQSYINNRSSTEVQSRGRSVYRRGNIELLAQDEDRHEAYFSVPSQNRNGEYTVRIKEQSDGMIYSTCTCPFDWGGLCKHEIAVLLVIIDDLSPGNRRGKSLRHLKKKTVTREVYDQKNTTFPATSSISDFQAFAHVNEYGRYWQLDEIARPSNTKVIIESVEKNFVQLRLTNLAAPQDSNIVSFKVHENTVESSCDCTAPSVRICLHKAACATLLITVLGTPPFTKLENLYAQINKSYKDFGIDPLLKASDLEFLLRPNKIKVVSSIEGLLPIHGGVLNGLVSNLQAFDQLPFGDRLDEINHRKLIILTLVDHTDELVPFVFVPFVGQMNKTGTRLLKKLTRLESVEDIPLSLISTNDRDLIDLSSQLSYWEINQMGSLIKKETNVNPSFENARIHELVYRKITALFELLKNRTIYSLSRNWDKITTDELTPLTISKKKARVLCSLIEDDEFLVTRFQMCIEDEAPLLNSEFNSYGSFIKFQDKLYLLEDAHQAMISSKHLFNKDYKVYNAVSDRFLEDVIGPLSGSMHMRNELSPTKVITQDSESPEAQIHLSEYGSLLNIQVKFAYNDNLCGFSNRDSTWNYKEGKLVIQKRDLDFEKEIIELIENCLLDQAASNGNGCYSIPITQLLQNNLWFNLVEQFTRHNLSVYGLQELKTIKQNPFRPKIEFRHGSRTDWFDLQVSIYYGEQKASLKEIRSALLKGNNFITLDDGTLGLLPEKWIEEHRDLFQMGSLKDDHIELSPLHFTIAEKYYQGTDIHGSAEDILKKKESLKSFNQILPSEVPLLLKAELRDYQKSGLDWLVFLNHYQFGGCLADDMGLGKTLQVIALFAYLKKQKNSTKTPHLVVMPKTLLFNWESEIQKFCPALKALTYFGHSRNKSMTEFSKYDLILTTYGMVRSDFDLFSQEQFNYVVLDESQAIKNSHSLASKAVKGLQSNRRLILTGTPIENNTGELFSQFDFVNPGLLGNYEFFKKEFGNPIDKDSNSDAANRLAKLIKPFILRRTKEIVADQLPDKTETILYCEMDRQQRDIYTNTKNEFRSKILQKIEEEGINKSRILILEGLTKLRQICDSPKLLANYHRYDGGSTKLQEVMREIDENTGKHKILVFSQFIKMLELIRQQLDSREIDFEYLDGQTKDRKACIQRFSEDPNCRVFLISLKAGGVGINLTEADYVYLIDPWWNPAVEQQAIDRTHRIGQTKKVFAYKLICKDTIEEKILLLQKKKKKLAEDIISAESGFVKNLVQQDIEELFS